MSVRKRKLIPYLLIAPNILIVVLFAIYPLIANLFTSFTDGSFGMTNFIGFDNYVRLFQDRSFSPSLINTLWYSLYLSVPTLVLSLLLAVGLNSVIHLKSTLRSSYLLPHLFSWVVIGLIWKWMYSSNYGILNALLERIGIPAQRWLLNPKMTLPCVAFTGIWANVGYYMVIFLTGLQSISPNYYEAAEIDGASGVKQFLYITIPSLRPIILLVINLVVIASFRVFDQIFVMTGGGPGRASFVMVLYIYIKGMQEGELGYASALSVIFFCVLMLVTCLLRLLLRDREQESRNEVK